MKLPPVEPSARLLALLAVALVAACASGPRKFEEHRAEAAADWQAAAARPDRPVASLGWAEAVAQMEAGNLKLRLAREAVRAGEEAVRQVPHNYIPELSLNLFAYPTVTTIREGSLGDTFFFLGGIVSLPNPARFRAEALQARLQFMTAQVECELLRRELHARLYRAFRKSAQLLRADSSQRALAQLAAASPDSPTAAQARELDRRNQASWQTIEPDLAELLGDFSKHWRPQAGSDLPALDYAAHPPNFAGPDRFAALQITRIALQLLALDAERQGLLVAEWPQVSVLLAAPPIYQRSAGRESYLSLGDVRVSGFISYSTDFRGTRALSRRQAERRRELTRHALDVTMQAAVGRLKDGLALLPELNSRLARLREAEAALRNSGALLAAENLHQQAAEVSDQIDELNLSCWVLDDPRWPLSP